MDGGKLCVQCFLLVECTARLYLPLPTSALQRGTEARYQGCPYVHTCPALLCLTHASRRSINTSGPTYAPPPVHVLHQPHPYPRGAAEPASPVPRRYCLTCAAHKCCLIQILPYTGTDCLTCAARKYCLTQVLQHTGTASYMYCLTCAAHKYCRSINSGTPALLITSRRAVRHDGASAKNDASPPPEVTPAGVHACSCSA